MAEITTAMVKELREATGAGILESRNALKEAEGEFDKAVQILRERGLAKASKKQDRTANQGVVFAHLEKEDTVGAMIELNCETDFVARTDRFQALAEQLAKLAVDREIDTADALLAEQVDGRSVKDLLTDAIATIGENIQLRRVARFAATNGDYITSYIHGGGRIGVMLEIGSASPEVAHVLTLQIAASSPRWVTAEDVSAEVVDSERNIYLAQMADEKKPDNIKAKIVEGKVEKFLDEVVLLRQPYVKDPTKSVQQLLDEEEVPVQVRRFARFELGAE
ncbi:MAG: translation elongation factor Ts [Anaerolineae bacterium]